MTELEIGIITDNPETEVWGLKWRSQTEVEFFEWVFDAPLDFLKHLFSQITNKPDTQKNFLDKNPYLIAYENAQIAGKYFAHLIT